MSKKDTLTKSIAAQDRAIDVELNRQAVVTAHLGQVLCDTKNSVGSLPKKERDAVKSIRSAIQNLEKSLEALLADEDRRITLQDEKKALNVEMRNLKNKEEDDLEALGRAAWDLWKAGRQPDPEMEEALEDLVKAEQRVHAAEDAVRRAESDAKGKRNSVMSKGKSFFLTGRKNTASNAMDRLWTKAGSRLMESVQPDAFADTPASAPMTALVELSDRRNEMQDRFEAIDSSLKELSGKGSIKKRTGIIEGDLEKKRLELNEAYRNLGDAWLDKSPEKVEGDVADLVSEREKIQKGIDAMRNKKKALESRAALIAAEKIRNQKIRDIEAIEKEIKSRQSVLKAAKKELTALEEELKKLSSSLSSTES